MHLAVNRSIWTLADVESIRRESRLLGVHLRFDAVGLESVALAVSELAMNLLRYATLGEITVGTLDRNGVRGMQVDSRDAGPGIANLELAMRDGYSTGGGLGSGLPAVRRLMDEFQITSQPSGTAICARKWVLPHPC